MWIRCRSPYWWTYCITKSKKKIIKSQENSSIHFFLGLLQAPVLFFQVEYLDSCLIFFSNTLFCKYWKQIIKNYPTLQGGILYTLLFNISMSICYTKEYTLIYICRCYFWISFSRYKGKTVNKLQTFVNICNSLERKLQFPL